MGLKLSEIDSGVSETKSSMFKISMDSQSAFFSEVKFHENEFDLNLHFQQKCFSHKKDIAPLTDSNYTQKMPISVLNQTRVGLKPTQRAATSIVSLIDFDSAHVQGTPRQTREIIATGLSQRFAELNATADDLFMTEAVDKYPSCGRSN